MRKEMFLTVANKIVNSVNWAVFSSFLHSGHPSFIMIAILFYLTYTDFSAMENVTDVCNTLFQISILPFSALYQMLLGWSNQRAWHGWDM